MEPDLQLLRQRAVSLLQEASKAASFEERKHLRTEAEHFAMLARRHEEAMTPREPASQPRPAT